VLAHGGEMGAARDEGDIGATLCEPRAMKATSAPPFASRAPK
jgi:hypothetical protein